MVSTRAASRAASVVPEATPPPSDSSSPDSVSALPAAPATPSTTRRRVSAKQQQQPATATKKRAGRSSAKSGPAAASASAWSYTPTTLTLAWLAISLPLVIWDTGYVLGRPHTFEGGSLHWPLYVPYELYATIDLVYSPKAWEAKLGFTGAQGALNAVETTIYFVYLFLFWTRAEAPASGSGRKTLYGRNGALVALLGFSAALMTLSKTVLYMANEYYSGFDSVGHNSVQDLVTLWIFPNTPWIFLPAYMVWSIGNSILDGIAPAANAAKKD